ncbi:hypothetical protein AtNW77_Chr1g0016411 [Arabidopsis thaliana]
MYQYLSSLVHFAFWPLRVDWENLVKPSTTYIHNNTKVPIRSDVEIKSICRIV